MHDINEVVLVGGSSRSPEVREMVRRALVLEGFSAYSLSSSPDPSTLPSSSSSSSSSTSQELHHTSSRTRSDGKGSSNTVTTYRSLPFLQSHSCRCIVSCSHKYGMDMYTYKHAHANTYRMHETYLLASLL
jgi:hypothetical protein